MNYTDRSAVYIHTGEDITKEIKHLMLKLMWVFILALTASVAVIYLYKNHQAILTDIEEVHNSLLSSGNSCNPSREEIKMGLIPTKIKITSQNMDLEIFPTHFKNGSWKVQEDVANYAIGTSLINMDKGNTGLYGIDTKQVFRNLKEVKKKDEIRITALNKDTDTEFDIVYEVESTGKIETKDSGLFYPKEDSQLTLIVTGESFTDQRYVVTAKPISLDKNDCN